LFMTRIRPPKPGSFSFSQAWNGRKTGHSFLAHATAISGLSGVTAGSMHPERLTELYRSYGAAIYARCRLLLMDDGAAEDATQETFLRVWRHLDRVPDAREALYWIYRVATNYCLNEIRDRRTRDIPSKQLPEVVDVSRAAEARFGDRDLARRLIERVSADLRVVAWLYHVDGFEQDEVAKVVGISRRTVVSRLADFRASAQKFIKGSVG
jgi:RNA polymerase sigma-70 factor, ECF subfamily